VLIIRRINCINITYGICHSVWVAVWYAGQEDGHLHRVTYTRRCIDATDSSDNEHEVARNMYRTEIKYKIKELCVKLVIYQNNTEMRSQ
jgi:hypothetical protein